MEKQNIILQKSVQFGVKVIHFCVSLPKNVATQVIGKQLIRSGTSTGANVTEAQDASSLKDFTQKMSIALREVKETKYWLYLLQQSGLVSLETIQPLSIVHCQFQSSEYSN